MPSSCVVPLCRNRGGHKFPNDPELRAKWEKAVRRNNFKATKFSKICKMHFVQSDFIGPSRHTGVKKAIDRLKKDVIPTVFPWTGTDQEFSSVNFEIVQCSRKNNSDSKGQVKTAPENSIVNAIVDSIKNGGGWINEVSIKKTTDDKRITDSDRESCVSDADCEDDEESMSNVECVLQSELFDSPTSESTKSPVKGVKIQGYREYLDKLKLFEQQKNVPKLIEPQKNSAQQKKKNEDSFALSCVEVIYDKNSETEQKEQNAQTV